MATRKEMKLRNAGALPKMSREEFIERINSLDNITLPAWRGEEIRFSGQRLKREKAFIAFLFLTGCRVSEVTKFWLPKNLNHMERKKNKVTGIIEKIPAPRETRILGGLAIIKKNVRFDWDENVMYVDNVRTLKRKKASPRNIGVYFGTEEDNLIERELVKIFVNYWKDIPIPPNFNQPPEMIEMFPFTRQYAYKVLSSIGLFNHYLRHLRLTQLVIDCNFDSVALKKYVNWASTQVADTYVNLGVEDLIAKQKYGRYGHDGTTKRIQKSFK